MPLGKKSELKATQVKLCTHTHTHKKDASSSASFSKPLLNTSVHVHAQCSPTPLPPKKRNRSVILLAVQLQAGYVANRILHLQGTSRQKKRVRQTLQQSSFAKR